MKESKLILKVEKEVKNGRPLFSRQQFKNIDDAASNSLLYKTGQALAALQEKRLECIIRQDNTVLEE